MALHCTAPPHAADEPSLTSAAAATRDTQKERERETGFRETVSRDLEFRGPLQSGTAAPLLAVRAELREAPGSRYDDLFYSGTPKYTFLSQ